MIPLMWGKLLTIEKILRSATILNIEKILTSATILKIVDLHKYCIVCTNASIEGIGRVLIHDNYVVCY